MGRIVLLCLILGSTLASPPLHAKPVWRRVAVPVRPKGASLGALWVGLSGDLYVWARTEAADGSGAPEAHLLHWDGERWSIPLRLSGHEPGDVFGADDMDVYASANKCSAGKSAGCGPDKGGRVFRSADRGATWTPQVLPPVADGQAVGRLGGTPGNVHAALGELSLLRSDGTRWDAGLIGSEGGSGRAVSFSIQSADEGYMVSCRGWGRWIGGEWRFNPAEFGFCDARGLWGARDGGGQLQLYAVDNNRFSNGVRIWKFNPPIEDFETVFSEESEDDWGSANGIWGSAADDIYVVGQIGDGARPGGGRIYRFDGKNWRRIKDVEPIPAPAGVSGSSRNDVWVSLSSGELLTYSTSRTRAARMAGPVE